MMKMTYGPLRLLGLLCSFPLLAACTGTLGDGPIDTGDGSIDSEDIDDTGSTGSNEGPDTGAGNQAPPGDDGFFDEPHAWTRSVKGMAADPSSKAIISHLASQGGWGSGQLRIDFGIEVLSASPTAPMVDFVPTDEFYHPDCDHVPVPLPPNGAVEAEDGYSCAGDGDCHLIVVDESSKTLYEMWRADLQDGVLHGGCTAKWDLERAYGKSLRGEGCTSADAGGFPIAPMLFSADEVAAGEIDHAIRFILPNDRIRAMTYVHPATHSTHSTSGGPDAPPYGVRLRLRDDYPLETLPSEGARVIARALQKYGMLLADGGSIALTGRSDRFTEHKWDEVGVDSFSLAGIEVTDMEVVDMGEPILWDGDCERTPH